MLKSEVQMNTGRFGRAIACFLAAVASAVAPLPADEGLWTPQQFPSQKVASRYGVEVSPQLIKHLQATSVRFNSGGSGAFVSASGLVMTNHHVGAECIQKLSSKTDDLMKNGFLARSRGEERRCPDLELNQLVDVRDATAEVRAGSESTSDAAAQLAIRQANIARIRRECAAGSGFRCDIVPLYSGGRFELHRYREFVDVRLVFAPEFSVAFLGGDPDNFEYPRYALDVAFFRVYEKGQPLDSSRHFLKWSRSGASDGGVIFVAGHPGTTQRLFTVAQMEFARDVALPLSLRRLEGLLAALNAYGAGSAERKRQTNDLLFGASNSEKASNGFLRGLKDPALQEAKRQQEARLRDAVESKPGLRDEFGTAWTEIARAIADNREVHRRHYLYEIASTGGSELLWLARTLYRMGEESAKPDAERLKEFQEAGRQELERYLFSTSPIYPEMEVAVIAENLRFMSAELGTADPVVRALLNGRTPQEAARLAIRDAGRLTVEARKRFAADPRTFRAEADADQDGLLRFVKVLDGPAREYRKRWEDRVAAVIERSAPRIAMARYQVYGDADYPDATFTLRITFGQVKGYTAQGGGKQAWFTDFAGLYRRQTGREPYRLPASWLRRRGSVNLSAPLNFVSTADIHGGNSGSPTVNAQGELVGIVFDSNQEALPNRYLYQDSAARAIHVASQGIEEALRSIYRADELVRELGLAAPPVRQ
jgi:hypothetical protein